MLLLACFCWSFCYCCWVSRAKSQEPSTSRAKIPPSPLLSRKKEKSNEKRESELRRRSRVHKSSEEDIFWYSIFWRKNSSSQCWVFYVPFFMSGGRLLNISDDVWASFRPLLSPVVSLDCSCFNWVDYFHFWSELHFYVCVCLDSLVLSLSTMCVWIVWCWAHQPCVCGRLGVVPNNHMCNLI